MTRIIVLVILIFLSSCSYCQQVNCDINIEYEQSDSQLIIEGTFNNNSTKTLDVIYYMTMTKKSKFSNSSTNQSGEVQIPVKSSIILARSSMYLSKDAAYNIHLVVQSKENVLADKKLEINGSEI